MAQAQNGGGEGQQQGGGSWLSGLMNRVLMLSVLYFVFVGNPFKPAQKDPATGQALPPHRNLMPELYDLDLWVYASESETAVDFTEPSSLMWHEQNIRYDDWSDSTWRKNQITFTPSDRLKNNGTMYAHIIMARHGTPTTAFTSAKALTKMAVQTIGSNKKNLITGESSNKEAAELPQGVKKIVSHWKGNLTISLVFDRTAYTRGSIPPQLDSHYKFDANGNYYPIMWINEFWLLRENLMPLNDTVKELKLDLAFEPLSLLKFSMYTQMDQSFSMQRDILGAEEAESEEFKHMLIDNPPWLLALTGTISLLHMVFDMLAFKNDIQFWKERKSMEGLSVRTIYFNLVTEGIIFLYLLDNNTSWMVLFSAGAALLIEGWKITRAVNVSIIRTASGIPWIKLTDKSTYVSKTKSFDQQAMQYLSYLIYPIIIGYSIYSFMYDEHKSIYSWLIGSLAGAVYTFGFIMMTPQLFINYKLKSVAHLPWRTFVYKALNTFIDDLFAFIIRMPTMHRLRVFRDDIIFVIYLYQRWIYPVDKNRLETAEGEANPADQQPQQEGDAAPGEQKAVEDKKND